MIDKSKGAAVDYAVAHTGAKTAKGGVAIGSAGSLAANLEGEFLKGVLVGDVVRYPDGSEAVVTSGAGFAACYKDRPYAIVGSHVSGGDQIISSPITCMALVVGEHNRPEGFLVEGYRYTGYVENAKGQSVTTAGYEMK